MAVEAQGAAAFEHIYDEHSGAVFRAALRILRDPIQAQDVVQDVFMRLWRQPERFDAERGTLVNYLRLMARSRALDVWREGQVAGRARARIQLLAARDEGLASRPGSAVELRRDRLVVLSAVERLPASQREAILMAYWGGLTADQIATRCGVPVGTVKSRLRLALAKLRESCAAQLAYEPALAA
jgi:RNA polymerase sigma-70 factor (ECF subfamily)